MINYYLISTLPTLKYSEMPAITPADFLNLCADYLGMREMFMLKHLALSPEAHFPTGNTTILQWHEWETCLRRHMAMLRTNDTGLKEKYVRPEKNFFSDLERGINDAFAMHDPQEREKSLDLLRWRRLDDLEFGHYFDIDKIYIYKLKLLIHEKWRGRNKESGYHNFTRITNAVSANGIGA